MIFFYILWQVGKGPDALSQTATLEVKDGRRSPFRVFALKTEKSKATEVAINWQVSVKK